MLVAIVAILCGLLLLADFVAGVKGLNRAVSALRPFATVIGVVAVVVGVLNLTSVLGLILILAGFILAASALATVPKIGAGLGRAGRALAPARALIGLLALSVGLFALFD